MPDVGRAANTGLLWLEDLVDMFGSVDYLWAEICKVADTFEKLVFKMPSLSTPWPDCLPVLVCAREAQQMDMQKTK